MNRHGFTLIEILMATVLSVTLMAGVLAIVAGLGPAALRVDAVPTADASGAMVYLIRRDLDNAYSVDASGVDDLAITGYAALDEQNAPVQRPVRVRYRFEVIDNRRWLVRRQWRLDVLTNHSESGELVCGDLVRFEITRRTIASAQHASPACVWTLTTWRVGQAAPQVCVLTAAGQVEP